VTETPSATTEATPPAAAQNTESTGQQSTEHLIPKSRFDEVNSRARAAEAELERIKTEREKTEREQAEKNGEWQKLAEKHTAELSEVKPKLKAAEDNLERVTTALEKHVKALRKDVPEHIAGLLDRLDPVDQLDWITKNGDQIGNGQPARGNGPNPRPAGQATHETRVQENQQKLQRTGVYNPF
jgi:hypothetical protein